MATLVHSLDDPVLRVSLDGLVCSWNLGAERIFGYTRPEVVGKPVSLLVPGERAADVTRWWRAVGEGAGVQRHQVAGVRKNGVVIELEVTISPLTDAADGLIGASLVARDVTEQRWMAATLESTLKSLEDALTDARASESRCRRFLADAAHQLRSPIAGIRASAETLLQGPSGPSEREAQGPSGPSEREAQGPSGPSEREAQGNGMEDREQLLLNVVRETSRAGRVMAGLLRMARLDQGETLTFRPCDVVGVCADEVARARCLAPDLDLDVQVLAEPISPPDLDANVVREVLANLLDNARRHAATRVEVRVSARGEMVEIGVLDDGPGLAGPDVDRVFERFVTLDGNGGSGLGLPIARGLARAHGGDLSYEDGFVLRVPRESPPVDCGGASRPVVASPRGETPRA